MKHKEYVVKKELAQACQRAMIDCAGDSIKASRSLRMNYQTFKHHIAWISDHGRDYMFPELGEFDHDDVSLMTKFGFPVLDDLRKWLVKHHSAIGKLAYFTGTNDELAKLMELAGLAVIKVGDRPYVHWKHSPIEETQTA
jgi:hypothetical protein